MPSLLPHDLCHGRSSSLAPGSDRIPVELFQILKDDAVESAALNMQYALNMKYAGSRQGLKPDVRQRLPFPQWLSLSYWGQGRIPSFWSRSPKCQARSGCVPSSMYAPLFQHCNPCHRGTRGASSCYKEIKQEQIYRLAAYRGPGYLQLAICASTSSSVSCPA